MNFPEFFVNVGRVKHSVRHATPRNQLPYQISTVKAAVEAVTEIDNIILQKVAIGDDNPLLGEYTRYERRESAYSSIVTTAEIYYANHMNTCWTRFVVCKEICHALLDGEDGRADTAEKVEELLEFLVQSKGAKHLISKASFQTEGLAEWAALEILCPVEDRRIILSKMQNGQDVSEIQIARDFRIPLDYVSVLFEEKFISYIEELLA